MSQKLPTDSTIRTSDVGSNDLAVALDNSSKVQLQKRPRRRLISKLLRCAAVATGEELLASWVARDRGKGGGYFTSRIPKMAFYGAFISTALTHFLLKGLRIAFAGRESSTAKVLEILAGMLVVAPIQKLVHILSLALIAGARNFNQLKATVKAGFRPAMAVVLFSAPVAVIFAQNVLPEILWPHFFNLASMLVHTFTNARIKKVRLAALRRKHCGEQSGISRT